MQVKSLLALLNALIVTSIASFARAQTPPPSTRTPVSDNTLGTQVSGANNNFTITGGLNRGQNLFHSFQDFSVPTGGSATFSNPVGNRSIITRVTGGNFSDIDGLVNTQGANFFLINPNGMVFGANAKLDVGQTFVGSTANGIDFVDAGGNAYRFGTSGNDAPLLTINPNALLTPARLIMGTSSPNSRGIVNYGTIDPSNDNQYVGLIGGNVTLDGIFSRVNISATGGRVDIGGLNSAGSITIGEQGLVYEGSNIIRSDVFLSNFALVYAKDNINIDAKQLTLQNAPVIASSTFDSSKGGDITIKASDLVTLGGLAFRFGGQAIASTITSASRGSGDAGNISITAPTVNLANGSQISLDTIETGRGGNLKIIADRKVSVEGGSQISSSTRGLGQGGNLTINTQELEVIGSGFGAVSQITTQSGGFISLNLDPAANQKDAGNLTIETGKLTVKDGARVSTTTFTKGKSGDLSVKALESIELSGTGIGTTGLSGGGLFSDSQAEAKGNAGNIIISTPKLVVTDGSQIGSGTFGEGDSGSIEIKDSRSVEISGSFQDITSGIFSSSEGSGSSGNVIINAERLQIRDSGSVSVKNLGQKDTGNIVVISRLIKLDNKGELIASSSFQNGGNIILEGQEIVSLRSNSKISATAGLSGSQGNGGNITINAPTGFIVTAPNENSDIAANAFNGSGGKVTIDTKQNFWIFPLSRTELQQRLGTTEPDRLDPQKLPTNDITAISQVNPNLPERVNITRPEIDPSRGLSPLPNTAVDLVSQIDPNCSPKALANNSFTSVGKGGLPDDPRKPLQQEPLVSSWVKLNPQDKQPSTPVASLPTTPQPFDTSTSSVHRSAQGKPLVEASGWRRERNGDIVLFATSSGNLPHSPQPQGGCVDR